MSDQPSAGDTMRSLRRSRDYSQAQVAEAVGITEGAVSQFENGRNAPSFATAKKIDAFLEADGRVLDAYGYVAPSSPEMRDQLAHMQAQLDAITAALPAWPVDVNRPDAELAARVAQLELDLAATQESLRTAMRAWRKERIALADEVDPPGEQVSED